MNIRIVKNCDIYF